MSDEKKGEPIKGVGVLRGPLDGDVTSVNGKTVTAYEWAQQVAQNLRQGCLLLLPNAKDENGNYLWDFRIEGGDSSQVIVRRYGK